MPSFNRRVDSDMALDFFLKSYCPKLSKLNAWRVEAERIRAPDSSSVVSVQQSAI